jgi:hypothetical protein
VTLPTATSPAGETGGQDFPFPPNLVEEMLRLFVKAVRAHQLYLPNNPVHQGALNALRGSFAPIWQHTSDLELRFGETEVKWHGKQVLLEPTKSADSISWTFFKDGVRAIQLSPGFEQEELGKLLDILQRLRKAAPDEDDLITMLWQSDFANLRYRYVDLGAEPAPTLQDGGAPPQKAEPGQVQAALQQAAETTNSLVNMQDFDATLYFLDDKELDYLRHEIQREYDSDLRANVIATLFDIYEHQTSAAIREEIGDIVENLIPLLLSAGQLRTVAFLLAEAQSTVIRAPEMTPAQKERLGKLAERLSSPDALGQLLQALEESADLPPQHELTELFAQLRPVALSTIFAWLPRVQNAKVKPLVEQAADRLAATHTADLVKLVLSKDQTVAIEAIRRAGAMKTQAAAAPLAKVLVEGTVPMRQQAVKALTDIGSPGALQALEKSIEDRDRDVRVAAVRTLGAKAYKGVFSRLDAAVKGKIVRDADLTEKMAFFEAYGAMCGDAGVPFLDNILNGKGMFGRREESELRACAAIALGRIGTRKAHDSLRRASDEKDIVVRNAITRALRGAGAGASP